jgi:1-deoxy-D-xylulose-5-phosphate reductoisomerase
MMNKGLELIEAHHLFEMEAARLDVVVHPQSIVHGLVEYIDGSIIAQLGAHDMRIPIAYCLAWPERIAGPAARLDLAQLATLSFEAPDPIRFPALAVTRQALEIGGAAPTVLNAANEIAVEAFLGDRIGFTGIVELVAAVLEAAERRGGLKEPQNVEEAIAVDQMARSLAQDRLREIAAKAS